MAGNQLRTRLAAQGARMPFMLPRWQAPLLDAPHADASGLFNPSKDLASSKVMRNMLGMIVPGHEAVHFDVA